MIDLMNCAEAIRKRLEERRNKKELEFFRIYVRLNFTLDVYVVSDLSEEEAAQRFGPRNELWEGLELAKRSVNFVYVPTWEAHEGYYAQRLSGDADVVDYGQRHRLAALSQPTRHSAPSLDMSQLPPVVLFYSYKGGVGRTTTAVGYALWLASKGKRVALIDADLEAPGYLSFFDLDNQYDLKAGQRRGLVEFLSDVAFRQGGQRDGIDVSQYVVVPDRRLDDGTRDPYSNIVLVPGGNLTEGEAGDVPDRRDEYVDALSRLNLGNRAMLMEGLTLLIDKLRKDLGVQVVVFDSRTGFNDVFATSSLDLARHVVGFFGYSAQSRPGLMQLLKMYHTTDRPFGLSLVSAILPEETSERSEWFSERRKALEAVCQQAENAWGAPDASRGLPVRYDLHRDATLERLGLHDNDADRYFVELAEKGGGSDYQSIFEGVTEAIGLNTAEPQESALPEVASPVDVQGGRRLTSLRLTKIVLQGLEQNLDKIKAFAEDATFGKEQFLYRSWMVDIFDPSKFVICGRKGTGKTYVYRALSEPDKEDIRELIVLRAKMSMGKGAVGFDPETPTRFVNVISAEAKGTHPISKLSPAILEGRESYDFAAFWHVVTWNALLSDSAFAEVAESSHLADMLFPELDGYKAVTRIDEIIAKGSTALAAIEDDLSAANELLRARGEQLFLLYDRLDTVVNPMNWRRAVSPLFNTWREATDQYTNIHPKIFVRTDLKGQLEGTNIERLRERITDIDWSVEEVFGYLFKLILSKPESEQAFWELYRRKRKYDDEAAVEQSIVIRQRSFSNGLGQFVTMDRSTLLPLVEVFFGSNVKPRGSQYGLGSPWDYFRSELSNADGTISLRPFINMLCCREVFEEAMQDPTQHVRSVINSEIYASKEVRNKAIDSYYNDLASDQDYTGDLRPIHDFLLSQAGEPYRCKVLKESEFEALVRQLFDSGQQFNEVSKPADVFQLLEAAGVMQMVAKPGGKQYRFASMYYYTWNLRNAGEAAQSDSVEELVLGKTYRGEYAGNYYVQYGERRLKCKGCEGGLLRRLKEGADVTFVVNEEPDRFKEGKMYQYATDVRLVE